MGGKSKYLKEHHTIQKDSSSDDTSHKHIEMTLDDFSNDDELFGFQTLNGELVIGEYVLVRISNTVFHMKNLNL